MAKRNRESVAEGVILCQSALLFLFGLAGFMASSTINSAFKALTDSETAVAFITDGAVVTSEGDIPTDRVAGIVGNFELVCVTSMLAGVAILTASLLRKYYK